MHACFCNKQTTGLHSIFVVEQSKVPLWLDTITSDQKAYFVKLNQAATPPNFVLLPSHDENSEWFSVVVVLQDIKNLNVFYDLPALLPSGDYELKLFSIQDEAQLWQRCMLAWGYGAYRFTRYQVNASAVAARLYLPATTSANFIVSTIEADELVRDLINTPAMDLGPAELVNAVKKVGKHYGAHVNVWSGDNLLREGFPTVYIVGQASHRKPHVVELQWGDSEKPCITLVGKGVCFDSGGLNIKPSAGMRWMKKDMAGAAHALGLAKLIMAHKLPVQLRLLIGAVDNAVGPASYRPGDIIRTRSGKTVEVTNTDAEGRLVICDLLTAAVEEAPARLIDLTTLTGAARIALGPKIAALFCNDELMAQGLLSSSHHADDPIWPLPLYQPYRDYLKSNIADLANASQGPFAGAITAALFLETFVPLTTPWAHIDMSAWHYSPSGMQVDTARAMAIWSIFDYLQKEYGL